MRVVVSFDLYSGLPNPQWYLSDCEVEQLCTMLNDASAVTITNTRFQLDRFSSYRGYSLLLQTENSPDFFYRGWADWLVSTNQARVPELRRIQGLERWLLQSRLNRLMPTERQFITRTSESLYYWEQEFVTFFPTINYPNPEDHDPELSRWNSNDAIRNQNNCYNYANNVFSLGSPAQPGCSRGGHLPFPNTCHAIQEATIWDGLAPLDCSRIDAYSGPGSVVALAMSEQNGYHWYRRDGDSTWSQKRGQSYATRLDMSDKKIVSPYRCDRRDFPFFCGYFVSKQDNIRIVSCL